jgi:hypothetical protein
MTKTAIKQVNLKLERQPDTFLNEVEKHSDFLTFKHFREQGIVYIPQWQKDIVLNRLNNPQEVVDAFEILDGLEKRKSSRLPLIVK